MTTELKEKQSTRLDVELPDVSGVIADVINAYQKELDQEYPDHLIDSNQAEKYAHIWLEMQFERSKRTLTERERDLANLASKNNKG